uniref:HHLA2 member of B7 family n=1 Tax=Phocoena sinus TaxID=42100 RepID=A0A8C9AY42_PHOSS
MCSGNKNQQESLIYIIYIISSNCNMFFLASLSHVPMSEQIVIGRLDEGVILPCSFESGPDVVVHWKNQDNYAYSYYKDRDQLEKQDPRYVNRTSLFLGTYICYVGTSLGKIINKVVLKVGAFVTPVMKYEKNTTNSFLICNISSVYPYPIITWKVDNTPISENNKEEIGSLGPFYINSRVNITGSNSSYQCAIENTLLKQTWTGRWTMKDGLRKKQRENVSLSCKPENSFFLPNEDFRVTWSRVDSGNSLVLAQFLNSSQETIINEPLLSRNKALINLHDFSLTLKDLRLSDSGEYLCNISSSKYTLLTIQTLHVGKLQVGLHNGFRFLLTTVPHLCLMVQEEVRIWTLLDAGEVWSVNLVKTVTKGHLKHYVYA